MIIIITENFELPPTHDKRVTLLHYLRM